jgi:ATP-binding cassette subfamily B protein
MADADKQDGKKKLTTRQYAIAIIAVAKETYKAAPFPAAMQVLGALITALLPIIATYFAALATTSLAEAYAGKPGAGNAAIVYVVITSLVTVLLAGWNSYSRYLTEYMRYRVEAAMSDRMYEHFLQLDFWRYDDKDTADLYDRAQDFGRFFPYVFDRVSNLVSQMISAVTAVIALAFVSWWISLIVLIAIIPSVYIQFKLSRAQVAHRNANVATRRSKNIIEWILSDQHSTPELRLYGLVQSLLGLRKELRDKDEKARIEFERQYIVKQLGAELLQSVAGVIALVYVIIQITNRLQPIGQFIYVQQIVNRALNSAEGFVSQLSTLDEDLANLFDYQKFMALPTRTGGTEHMRSAPKEIAIEHVSFHYPSSKTKVLDDVSLTIDKHQHVAIVGENGAGKSTLIKILTGLYPPVDGQVLLDGRDLQSIDIVDWHRQLGVLQQETIKFRFANTKDNVTYGDVSRDFDQGRYDQALKHAEAKSFIDKLPKGDATYVNPWMEDEDGTKGIDLSGGQWQRLSLARNLYRDSPIIILDEPTSAIDALAESRIFNHLLKDKTKTIITISHRLTTVQKADKIYMLENGKVVEQGTHNELVKKHGAYYTMFESQLH